MGKKKVKKQGVCKLTLQPGRFVDAHILPKALTKAEGFEPWLEQFGNFRRERRFSSWYDKALVTEEGEAILSAYDDWAIAFLRKQKLVWSGWGPVQTLDDTRPVPDLPWGGREIVFQNLEEARKLRVFLLSLLWRAASSARWEMEEVQLEPDSLELLRGMVTRGDPEPLGFMPASLIQFSTLGKPHNHSPIAQVKQMPAVADQPAYDEPIFRFFLDGLIVHFSRLSIEKNMKRGLERVFVGSHERLVVSTVPFENSAHLQNIMITAETELGRPWYELDYTPFLKG